MIGRAAILILLVAGCGAAAPLPVGSPPPPAAPLAPLVVIEVAARHYAVVAVDAEAAWGRGELGAPMHVGYQYAVTRATAGLPARHAAWIGRTLAVHAADGSTCHATIDGLRLLAAETPPFGLVDRWQSDLVDPPIIGAQIADEVFAGDELMLVAELGACRGVVAVDAGAAGPPAFLVPREPDPSTRARALRAFAALPASRALQREHEELEGTGRWNRDLTRVMTYASAGGELAFVTVYGKAGGGCGEWYGELSAVFLVDHGELRPLRNDDALVFRATAMADLDGDGSVELIGTTGSAGGGWTVVDTGAGLLAREADIELPFHACMC
jgi:hypothetical protein